MKAVAFLISLCVLGGCASGGGIDDAMKTSSVAAATAPVTDQTQMLDSATIRNAVSAADLEALGAAPLAWANTATGSRGSIANVTESKVSGTLCRSFTVSRESFDGVGLYKGEACQAGPGAWQMLAFEQM